MLMDKKTTRRDFLASTTALDLTVTAASTMWSEAAKAEPTKGGHLKIGIGVAYGIFGGLTPLTAAYLVRRTGDDFAPVYRMIAFAFLSFLAVLRLPETLPRLGGAGAAP